MRHLSRVTGIFLATISFAHGASTGERHVAQQHATVNFTELAEREARSPATLELPLRVVPRPRRPESSLQLQLESTSATTTELAAALVLAPSPPPTTSFLALLDDGTTIPPDTMGAVGPNHVMTTLNSQVRIQNRSGTKLSTVSMNSFWASLGNPDAFDPRVAYDPFRKRWIFSASANSESAAASILVGASATSDPTGNWFLFRTDADSANQAWADFDGLGFNKDWVIVSANMFLNKGGFRGVWFWAFDKADLYANGTGAFTLLKSTTGNAFSVAPAQTHDNSLATEYLVEDWDGSTGRLRVSTITGPVGSEVLTIGISFPTASDQWATYAGNDFSPQLGTTHGIDAGDSRILSCSFRNGSLWVSHTAFLPVDSPTRAAAQWWQFLPGGTVQQFGRIEDPSGNQFFTYPSIAANASNDVLIGYSRFSSSQYASANYSFRFASDPPNTMRPDTVLHAGEGLYLKSDGSANRWGDFSATCVDPVNDMTMWTIQEYASTNRWSTWWGRIDPDLSALKLVLTRPADGVSYPTNPTVTFTATRFDTNTTFSKVEFFADGTKVGETNAEPYTINWSGVANGTHVLSAIGTETLGGMTTSAVVIVNVGDPTSPVGTWETKLSGAGKGTAVVLFNDDFTVTGHGMVLGQFGLFTISGTWGFNQKHMTEATYMETLESTNIYSGNLVAKVTAGKTFSATVSPTMSLVPPLKLKGIPLAPVPDLTGDWSATVKTGTLTAMENYQFAASPTLLNVFNMTGSTTGMVLETAKGQINISTDGFPERSLAGKAKDSSFTAKGADARTIPINIKAIKQ